MIKKLKYFWQAFKCSWGYHDLHVEHHKFISPLADLFEAYQGTTCSMYKCKFCDYQELFTTVEFKGEFQVEEI